MEIFSFLFFCAFIAVAAFQLRAKGIGTEEELRAAADSSLHWELAGSLGKGFSTEGLQVVDRIDEFFRNDESDIITNYECHFLVRNAKGEYLFFLYRHNERPFIKLTAQAVAKARLGDRYLPPP